MTWYRNENTFTRRERRIKPKRKTLRGFIILLLLLCCTLAVMILVDQINSVPFAINRQPDVYLTTNAPIYADDNIDIIADTQSNGEGIFILDNAGDISAQNTTDTSGAVSDLAWHLILVNKWNFIPDDYQVELSVLANGQSVDKRIYPALQEMFDTARSNGIYPVVVSGFRTAETQQNLLDQKIADYKARDYSEEIAIAKAESWVAIPGTSEHQLGIAVDINADGIRSTGEEVYSWLNQNSYKFGFIRRYPDDKIEITGISNEPWHYRYVGIEEAIKMYYHGICLEEYLDMINLEGKMI